MYSFAHLPGFEPPTTLPFAIYVVIREAHLPRPIKLQPILIIIIIIIILLLNIKKILNIYSFI
jgi:ABC-type phosphate transport system permease subunit